MYTKQNMFSPVQLCICVFVYLCVYVFMYLIRLQMLHLLSALQ